MKKRRKSASYNVIILTPYAGYIIYTISILLNVKRNDAQNMWRLPETKALVNAEEFVKKRKRTPSNDKIKTHFIFFLLKSIAIALASTTYDDCR